MKTNEKAAPPPRGSEGRGKRGEVEGREKREFVKGRAATC